MGLGSDGAKVDDRKDLMLKETYKINEIGVLDFTFTLCCYMMKNSHLFLSIKLIRVLIINLGNYTLSNLSYPLVMMSVGIVSHMKLLEGREVWV